MAKRSNDLSIRLSVEDAEKARAALLAFGKDGQKALEAIEGAGKKAGVGLTALDRGVRGLGEAVAYVGGPLDAMTGRVSGLTGLIGRTGIAFGAAGLAVAGGALAIQKMTMAAADAEREQFKLEALVKATGGAAGLTAEQIDKLTLALAKSTLATDGQAKAAAAQLLTFKSVSGETFARTLTLAQDLASTGFGTLESATVMLGKALEDPVRGLSALRRVGVSFTAAQEDVIEKMVESGDTAKAMGLILDTVSQQVGGTGEAEAKGLAGAFHRASESIGEFLETAGRLSGTTFVYGSVAKLAAQAADSAQAALEPASLSDKILANAQARADFDKRMAGIRAEGPGAIGALGLSLIQAEGARLDRERQELEDLQRAVQGETLAAVARQELSAQQRAADVAEGKRRADQKKADDAAEKEREKNRPRAQDNLAALNDAALKATTTPIQQAMEEMHRAQARLEADQAAGLISYEAMMQGRADALTVYVAAHQEAEEKTRKEAEKSAADMEKLNEKRANDRADAVRQLAEFGDLAATPVQASLRKIQREYAANLRVVEGYVEKGLATEAEAGQARAALLIGYEKDILAAREKTFGQKALGEAQAYFELLADAGGRAGGFLVGQIRNLEDALTDFFETGKINAASFFDAVKGTVARTLAQDVVSGIGGLFGQSSGSTVTGGFLGGLLGGGASAAGSAVGGLLSSVGSGIASFFGFSEGGLVRGPGTPTSDSIAARLSDGEFVVNARAARRNLPLLRQINAPGSFASARRRRGFAWGGSASDDDFGSDYGDSDAFGSSYSGEGGGLSASNNSAGFDSPSIDHDANPGPEHPFGYQGNRAGPSATGLQSLIDPDGRVVDRWGGTLGEKIGTFFGAGTDAGFFGSRAGAVVATLLGGLVGGLPGVLLGGALNLGREFVTDGAALQSPGPIGEIVGRLGDHFSGQRRRDETGSSVAAGEPEGSRPGRSVPANPAAIERDGGDVAAAMAAQAALTSQLIDQMALLRREMAQRDETIARFTQMFGGAFAPRRNQVF